MNFSFRDSGLRKVFETLKPILPEGIIIELKEY